MTVTNPQSDDPKQVVEISVQILAGSMGKERAYQKIIYQLIDFFQDVQAAFDHNTFSTNLPGELRAMYNKSLLFPLPKLSKETFSAEVNFIEASRNLGGSTALALSHRKPEGCVGDGPV